MAKTVWIISFKLKKDVSKEDFIAATQRLHDEVLSKAKGFISWEQYLQGDIWTDFVIWESLEDAKSAKTIGQGREEAKKFYAMLQMNTCTMLVSELVKSY